MYKSQQRDHLAHSRYLVDGGLVIGLGLLFCFVICLPMVRVQFHAITSYALDVK